jgi:hypothetical protein
MAQQNMFMQGQAKLTKDHDKVTTQIVKGDDLKKIENYIKNLADKKEAYANHFSSNTEIQK